MIFMPWNLPGPALYSACWDCSPVLSGQNIPGGISGVMIPNRLGAAIALLIYLAYFVLRNSLTDPDKSARISAVYNVFAFAMLFPTIWIIPRLVESLHPGGMGNPAFNTKDIDSRMRLIFYFGAIPGWALLGVWICSLRIRIQLLSLNQESNV